MPGTKEGGVKAAKTNRLRHGDDFYSRLGKKGGGKRLNSGFTINGLARVAGAKGGSKSRRGKAKK